MDTIEQPDVARERIESLRQHYDQRTKITRTRKPWVYKSEYDKLQRMYTIVRWFAIVGWIAFSIALKIAL